MAVLHTVLHKNTRAGLWVALGASLPELPYSFLAVMAVQYVSAYESIKPILEVGTVIALLSMGAYITFFQKKKKVDFEEEEDIKRISVHPFWKGFFVAAFNPLLVAFWLVASDFGKNIGCLDVNEPYDQLAFVVGTSLGALALLALMAVFTKKIKERLTNEHIFILTKTVGLLFVVMGVVQAVKQYLYHF